LILQTPLLCIHPVGFIINGVFGKSDFFISLAFFKENFLNRTVVSGYVLPIISL